MDRPLGLLEVAVSRISRQPVHKGGKVVSPMHQPPFPKEDISGTHFCSSLYIPHVEVAYYMEKLQASKGLIYIDINSKQHNLGRQYV
jgi:hypothetical protein